MKNSTIVFFFLAFFFVFGQNLEHSTNNLIKLSEEARETNRAKSLSYIQEALKMEKELSDSTLLNLYKAAGLIYKDRDSYFMALNYFYKELEINEKLNSSESFFIYNNIGGCYYLLGDKAKARKFWEKSLADYEKYIKGIKNNHANKEGSLIYNNLAVLEKEQGNYAKALEMLKEFKSQNILLKDTLNIIMAQENLADVYMNFNETETAVSEIHKGLVLAKAINSAYDLSSLRMKLGDIFLKNKKDSALYYLKSAYDLSEKHGFVDIKLSSAEKLVSLYENNGNYKEALQYLHTAKSLSEESIGNENTKQVSRIEEEFIEKMKHEELIQSQKKKEIYLIVGIILLMLFSAIIFLMLQLQKNRNQKRIAENQLMANELEEKNKVLTSNAIKMLQTSEILNSTHKELRELKSDNPNKRILSKIITDMKKGTQTFNKVEFEKLFMETDRDFYKRLLKQFPNLTKNELRLCAFLRLNLSSKEISAITQQSPHSIIVASSRLRKKLLLSESESLNNFLIKYG